MEDLDLVVPKVEPKAESDDLELENVFLVFSRIKLQNWELVYLPWQLVLPKMEPLEGDIEVGFRTKMEPEVIINEDDGDVDTPQSTHGHRTMPRFVNERVANEGPLRYRLDTGLSSDVNWQPMVVLERVNVAKLMTIDMERHVERTQIRNKDLDSIRLPVYSHETDVQEKQSATLYAEEDSNEEESDPGTDRQVSCGADEILKDQQATDDTNGPCTCKWTAQDEKDQPSRCSKSFMSISDLVSHLREEHLESSLVCLWQGCKRTAVPFADRTALTRHLRTHSGEKPYPCPHEGCGKSFGQRTALRCHLSTHSTGKYQCSYPGCGKVYSQKRSLTLHHKVRHTGERGFRCEEESCDRVFNDAASLRKHCSLRHTTSKPFACGFACCSHSFASKEGRDEHLAHHVTGYRCRFDGCGQKCRDSWTLRVHERMHTGEKPFPCPNCGVSFTTAVIRNTHVRRRHGTIQNST